MDGDLRMEDGRGRVWLRGLLPWVLAGVWMAVAGAFAAGAAGAAGTGEAPLQGVEPALPAGASASPQLAGSGLGEGLLPGATLQRAFTVEDPRLDDDSPYHLYWFEAQAGAQIRLVMRSYDVDPYLWLYGPQGRLLARDDDSGPGRYDATVNLQAPEDGLYRVLANTALGWQRGPYRISLELREPASSPGSAGGGTGAGGAGSGGPETRGTLPEPIRPPGEAPGLRGLAAGSGAAPATGSVPPVEGELDPGVRRSGVVGNTDLLHFWRVVLPEGTNQFEVGLFNATGPLDLVATPEVPVEPGVGDFPHKAMTGRENERLHVFLEPDGPRRWLVGVVNWEPVSIRYEIEVSLTRPLPPYPEYKPPLPQTVAALSPLERAIRATVQISTPEGSASGTLVTPDGLILTNYHVVGECRFADELFGCEGGLLRDEEGELVELIVGLPHEARGAATQYFLAQVLKALPQYDLALLQITQDLNGVPARGPIFPWIPLDLSPDAVRLGDEVMVIGYPAIAQTAGRIPLSLTRGVLSGFTVHEGKRVLLQTDAAIEAGHSGGALIRLPEARLVGVPSDTRLDWETFEKQNYARPVTLLPQDWLEILEQHGAILHNARPATGAVAAGGGPAVAPTP